jgi:hypothetical protein
MDRLAIASVSGLDPNVVAARCTLLGDEEVRALRRRDTSIVARLSRNSSPQAAV